MLFGLISPTLLADFVAFVESTGPVAPVVYSVTFTLATVACLPSSLIEIISGFLFPLPVALAVNITGKFTGAVLAFVLGKTACKDFVSRKAQGIKVLRALRVAINAHSNAFKLALLLRLSPAPIFVKNYGLGALELSLVNFMAATAISAVPMGIVWAMVGGAARDAGGGIMDLVSDDQPSGMDRLSPTVKGVMLLVGVIIMVLLGIYVKRTLAEVIAEEDNKDDNLQGGDDRGKEKTS